MPKRNSGDFAERGRILLVSPASPFPSNSGGAQRTALLYRALAEDASVDLYLFEGSQLDAEARQILTAEFRAVGFFKDVSSVLRPAWLKLVAAFSPHLRSVLPDEAKVREVAKLIERGSYRTIVLRYSATACQLARLRQRKPDVRILVDVDDSLALLMKRPSINRPADRQSRISSLCAEWIARRERDVLLAADGLWINGKRPVWLDRDGPPPVVELLNIPMNRAADPPPDAPKNCPVTFLGVGQFRYRPNYEGFDWFLREIWPDIRQSLPSAKLRLVGLPPNPPHLDNWRSTPGVDVVGQVEDLKAEYAAATVAIAPILRGAGTKIKVVEALAMGVPCVASPVAATGLDALTSLLVADDPHTFAKHCLDLAANVPRREMLASAGIREVESNFSWANFLAGVRSLAFGDPPNEGR